MADGAPGAGSESCAATSFWRALVVHSRRRGDFSERTILLPRSTTPFSPGLSAAPPHRHTTAESSARRFVAFVEMNVLFSTRASDTFARRTPQ